MEMAYESFVETLRKNLLEETDYEDDMICYKKTAEQWNYGGLCTICGRSV